MTRMNLRGDAGLINKIIKNQYLISLILKLNLALFVLIGCGMGGGSGVAPVGGPPGQELNINAADQGQTKNTPDFPGGVPAPDSNWEPCLDEAHCNEKEKSEPAENEPDQADSPGSNSNDAPTNMWDDIKNNPPERPKGKIKMPGK